VIDGERGARICDEISLKKGWGTKRIHEELMSTPATIHTRSPKSKSGFRTSGTVIYPAKTLRAPDGLS
jgi:hypothetical protein